MHDFNWFGWLFGATHENVHIYTAAFVAVVLIAAAFVANRSLRRLEENIVPNSKFGIASIFEIIIEVAVKMMRDLMGERRAYAYFPLIGGLFIYIFASNFLGVIPGFIPPTDNINTNAACAIVVFLYYNFVGIKEQGLVHYLKHFMGPVLWLAPLMVVVELIGHLVRPVSLSVRLFGNMMGDHMVLGIFSNLVPLFVPIIFMALGLFVAFIQAFVFSLLSMVYIALATETGEHH